jgi:hypothetical protein
MLTGDGKLHRFFEGGETMSEMNHEYKCEVKEVCVCTDLSTCECCRDKLASKLKQRYRPLRGGFILPEHEQRELEKKYPDNGLLQKIRDEALAGDPVDHPKHYTVGKIEVWDFIVDQKMNYLEGNVVKYVSRYKTKNGVEDLKKARAYLDKLIQGFDV